ncbi:MAG: hypothetical protein IJW14_04280 [Oscillospiraceae bacterium]|nr:hypothetical protein [Oscillospiraceae bacterium]
MDQNDNLEFELEDIMREFGDSPVAVAQPESEPESEAEPETEAVEEVSGDTIRLDQIRKAVSDAAGGSVEDTAVFTPVHIEEEEEPLPVAEETPGESVEPFSEEWEPEYEEPMGDYPIPEPIVFRPKQRLKELRAKLVAGPEQRYYALTELGTGKLQLAALVNFIVFILSAGFTALYAWGMVPPERLRLLVFVQFLGMLLSALLGCYRLLDGIGDMTRLRFSTNSLLVFTFAACCVDSVLCLQELRIPVSAAFSLEMTMASWAACNRRSAEIGMMDTLRRAITLDSVVCVPDYYEGKAGVCVGRGEVEHFMDHYAAPSTPEKVLNWYALSALIVSLAAGILAGVRHGFSTGVQLCASALLVGMPATAFLSVTRPLAILEKRLHKLGVVLCGWKGVRALGRRAAYPLTDADLFPSGAAKLNGMKFYGDRDPDLVVAYATALIKANGGALVGLFSRLLDSRNGYYYTVDNLNCYAGGGIGGQIGDDAVLVGTLEFMHDMGVDMGEGTRVSQAVYAAIDGELCGVFAVSYQKSKSTVAGLRTLCGYPGLTPVVVCEDFMLSQSFVQSRFGINSRRMAFPGREVRRELAMREPAELDPVIALTTKEGLAPKAFAVTGARVLRSAMKAGVAVHMVGGILGLLMMLALAYVGPGTILTPSNILLYELIWMVPGLLITEWTRTL